MWHCLDEFPRPSSVIFETPPASDWSRVPAQQNGMNLTQKPERKRKTSSHPSEAVLHRGNIV